MESFWVQHEGAAAWSAALSAFVAFALWESYVPRRALAAPAGRRWLNHAALSLLTNRSAVWLFRAGGVMVAYSVAGSRYGLLNRPILPIWLRYALAVLLLDLVRYGHHYLYHRTPLLWRIHQVHHSDPDYDWSTGLRFHPLEACVSQGLDLLAIALLAPPPLAIVGIDVAEGALNIFQHANIRLPARIGDALRYVLITPDTHRIHHSDDIAEQNTNFGAIFPWWDRAFGTYRREPAAGHERMGLGLRELPQPDGSSLLGMLAMPFRGLAPRDAGARPPARAVSDR